jgi:hypothetical protein
VKFLADMGVSLFTVAWLRSSGYDAIHLRDEGLQRLPDSEILIKARQEERVLLTMDLDFGMLLAMNKNQFPASFYFASVTNGRKLSMNDWSQYLLNVEKYWKREQSFQSVMKLFALDLCHYEGFESVK